MLLIGGNKAEGIKKLETVSEKGIFAQTMASVFLAEGLGLYERQYQRSIGIYADLIRRYPDNSRYRLNEALMLGFVDINLSLSRFQELVRSTESGRPTYRKDMLPFYHLVMGNLYRLKKDYDLSLLEYQKCIDDKSAKARFVIWAWVERGRTLDLMGMRRDAIKSYYGALYLPDFNGAYDAARSGKDRAFKEDEVVKKAEDTIFRVLGIPQVN
jgi:tetratricopeptide (TPR) repeat protein